MWSGPIPVALRQRFFVPSGRLVEWSDQTAVIGELTVNGKSSLGPRLDQPLPPSQHVSQMVWHREQISLPRCSISVPPHTGHEGGHDSGVCSCFGEAGVFGESTIAPLAETEGSQVVSSFGKMFFILGACPRIN
jgi:hypothetical protein